MASPADIPALLGQAAQLRRQGRPAEARRLVQQAAGVAPGHPAVLNAQANTAMADGRAADAIPLFRRAVEADPGAALLWHALAGAQTAVGDHQGAIASLDRAIAIDPYMLPALLAKAQALERIGRPADAAHLYRALAATTPDPAALPPPIAAALAHGRDVVAADDARRGAAIEARATAALAAHPGAAADRARAYAETVAGRRKTYVQQPTGAFFPYLPAIDYFDRDRFAWFDALEAGTDAIRAEYRALAAGFGPYVAYAPGTPVNQWAELNHSPRWSAFFLWKDGVRDDANCARCPETARLMERLPLLDVPNRGPTVMFSLLEPRTRIPPHTGVTNIRATVHLPLVVPEGCAFRVGAQTRPWVEGTAWAFDDTIEHEAWNDSDAPRAILIVDAWNPYLTDVERDVVRALGAVGRD